MINGHRLIYFDNAATSQKPIQVIEAMKNFYERHNANVHRAIHTIAQEATELYEEAHKEVATFIGAKGMEEVIFVRNTTEAINLVAYSLGLNDFNKEDEVVITLMEHHSDIVPWEMLSKVKGFHVKYVGVNEDGTLDYEALRNSITKRTKIVCLAHVSNVTGIINDVKEVAKMAHENGSYILIDGAQSVPHMPIDVKELDADFLAFSAHKMLGPTGIGVLYGKKEILEEMKPFLGGGEMIKEVKFDEERKRCMIEWNELPWKFEAGTPNICGSVGLMEAIRYLKKLGMENVEAHEKELTIYTLDMLNKLEDLQLIGTKDPKMRSGIISFNIGNLNVHDVALFLDGYGIAVRSGFHCAQPLHQKFKLNGSVRVSFYIYNTREEIDRLVVLLREIECAYG